VRDETVARNYADTLFELARAHEGVEVYGEGIAVVARLLEENPQFRLFLETPRIEAKAKKDVLRKAFAEALPRPLLNFLLVTVDKRRQRLLGAVAREYFGLLDEHQGRAHVEVTVARDPGAAELELITNRLSDLLGKTAVPHVRVRPDILGGMVVRAGDTIYDGSLRRRLDSLRRQLLHAELPGAEGAGRAATDIEG
jgi:F-type H+-transporting ATPase subunit delta